ncbi:hypothetical protein Dda_6509 [Drechslerella dactyloides]|uniref:Uncharacterized protein n=1 Tax=Drechslerella dactyloides TaxID=74499 RepID=A0AAD6ITM1_DREDA|nr:hypothetical protein Dda_6509 [Drechslerella dactyloides]
MKCYQLLGLGLAAVADGFILGLQLGDDPVMSIASYPYPNPDTEPVDLSECQRGPPSDSDVVAVGVLNRVSQDIKENTDQIMYGIALWQNTDCDGRPALIIGWRPEEPGMQVADLFRLGFAMPVGSWLDLEHDNAYLQMVPEGGFVFDVRGQRDYMYEDGQWVVQSGESESYEGALDELVERGARIQNTYAAAAAEEAVETNMEVEQMQPIAGTWFSPIIEPAQSANGGDDVLGIETIERSREAQGGPLQAGWRPLTLAEDMASSPFPLGLQDFGQRRQPLYTSTVQQDTSRETAPSFDEDLAALAYNLGRRNPMASLDDLQKGWPLMQMYLQSQRNPPDEQREPSGGWEQAFDQVFGYRGNPLQNEPTIGPLDRTRTQRPGERPAVTSWRQDNTRTPNYLQMFNSMLSPQQSQPRSFGNFLNGNFLSQQDTVRSTGDRPESIVDEGPTSLIPNNVFIPNNIYTENPNMGGPPPSPNANTQTSQASQNSQNSQSRSDRFANLVANQGIQPQPARFNEEYSPVSDYFSTDTNDV